MIKSLFYVILVLVLWVSFAQAITVHNEWDLYPGHVVMHIKGELPVFDDKEIVIGFMMEGFLGRPGDRKGHLDLAYIKAPSTIGTFTIGKYRPAWEYDGFSSIMLSGYAPGMVGVKYETSIFDIDYERFFTWMSDMRGKFFGHRLEVPIMPGVRLGVKETAIFAEEFDGFWINYVPLWPLYLTKYIPGVPSQYNKKNIGIDLKIDYFTDCLLYGDFLVTEYFQIPDQRNILVYGLFLGGKADNLYWDGFSVQIDYTRATNYLFTHRQEETFYEYKGRPLGTSLGQDSERFHVLFSYPTFPQITLHAGYRYERKGEGEIGNYYPPREKLEESIFLSGVVERRNIVVAGLSYEISSNIDLKILAEVQFLENADHIEGQAGVKTEGKVTIQWKF